ncbi:DUF4132 domain-containing protein [Aquisphaera insulae]|uniref:DUF4132 domain-containing protein n=1 Tax=Aquisphaera insulae TaxID=2712864 RepID=UPI0013EDFE0F|nr:DUF4132 domain-containing protein [Aquisphaera insulae]
MKSFRERALSGQLKYSAKNRDIETAFRFVETGDANSLGAIIGDNGLTLWLYHFVEAIDVPRRLGAEDRRAVELLLRLNAFPLAGSWLNRVLLEERPDEDFHTLVREIAESIGISSDVIDVMTVANVPHLLRGTEPNSAGRYVLDLDEARLTSALESAFTARGSYVHLVGLFRLLLGHGSERLDAVVPPVRDAGRLDATLAALLLEKGNGRFDDLVAEVWRALDDPLEQHKFSALLVTHDPDRHRAEARDRARQYLLLRGNRPNSGFIYIWLIETFGAEVLDDVEEFFRDEYVTSHSISMVAEALFTALGEVAVPALQLLTSHASRVVRLAAATYLVKAHTAGLDELLRETLANGLKEAIDDSNPYSHHDRKDWIRLIGDWNPAPFEALLSSLADLKATTVRDASAQAVAKIGEPVLPRILPRLDDGKKEVRLWATAVLTSIDTPAATAALEARLDEEDDDIVRDSMLEVIDAARTARGHFVTRDEIEARALRSEKKLRSLPAKWLDLAALPPLTWNDGAPIGERMTRYLFYRQSRAKATLADVEARPLFKMLDRQSGADFAHAVIRTYLSTKLAAADRWALAIAAILGDDRVVPFINRLIQECAESSRLLMAQLGLDALAMLGTDAALAIVDSLALRYRTKNKQVAAAAAEAFMAAAARKGVSVDELGDRVVPWLGFEPGKPRTLDIAGKLYQVQVGLDGKLGYRDVEKNRKIASLPKSTPGEILAGLKAEAVMLKDVIKGQLARLENLLVVQHRWQVARWQELFLNHPVLIPFGVRLVWGVYDAAGRLDGTFQALEDRSLTTAGDLPFELADEPGRSVGMVHPLELDRETLHAWRTHMADFEIAPPFPQLDRPVVTVRDDDLETRVSRSLQGTSLNAMTFRGRAERLGWTRGAVGDGGFVEDYRKTFSLTRLVVFLGIQGLYMGISRDESITLDDFCFVQREGADVPAYVSDRPNDASDPRLIPFRAVPPIVFSEVMADLAKIAGKSDEPAHGD